MIEPDGEEVIIGDTIRGAGELGGSIAEVLAIGCRKQVQDRFAACVYNYRSLTRQYSEMSVVVGHDRHGADALELAQTLIAAKEEGLVFSVVAGVLAFAERQHNGPADREPKLVPAKLRPPFGLTVSIWTAIEEVARIKVVIPQELKG